MLANLHSVQVMVQRLPGVVVVLSDFGMVLPGASWPVLLEVWSDKSVLTTEHVLLVLASLVVWVHIYVDILSDGLVSVVLHWLSIHIALERRTDTVCVATTNLSCLVGHLIDLAQWYLECACRIQWEVLAICAAEIRSSKLGNRIGIIQILEKLSCVLASKGWGI